jgi:hypothetical protein
MLSYVYISLQVKYSLFLSDFNKTNFSTDFRIIMYDIECKPVQREPSSMQTDRHDEANSHFLLFLQMRLKLVFEMTRSRTIDCIPFDILCKESGYQTKEGSLLYCCMKWRRSLRLSVCSGCGKYFTWKWCNLSGVFFLTAHTLPFRYNRWAGRLIYLLLCTFPRKLMYVPAVIQRCVFCCFNKCRGRELDVS